jgi:hypothetical protein
MSELPREAKELLELARDAHEPPDTGARERVRRGVATAMAVGAGMALSGKAIAGGGKAGLFASTGAKLVTLGSAIVLAGAVAVGAPLIAKQTEHEKTHPVHAPRRAEKRPAPPVVQAPAPAQPVIAAPAVEALEPAPVKTPPPEVRATPRRVHQARAEQVLPQEPVTDALRAEMLLLRAASDALTANQVGPALAKLDEHAQRFAHGQLGEEREGLRVIARCMRGERGASTAAQRYLKRHPQSLLAVRATSACKLDEGP